MSKQCDVVAVLTGSVAGILIIVSVALLLIIISILLLQQRKLKWQLTVLRSNYASAITQMNKSDLNTDDLGSDEMKSFADGISITALTASGRAEQVNLRRSLTNPMSEPQKDTEGTSKGKDGKANSTDKDGSKTLRRSILSGSSSRRRSMHSEKPPDEDDMNSGVFAVEAEAPKPTRRRSISDRFRGAPPPQTGELGAHTLAPSVI